MKLPMKWAAALVLLFLTALPALAFAQDAGLVGTVADETGGAIAGARLVLHTTHGAPVRETRSGANGAFAIGDLPSGLLLAGSDRGTVQSAANPRGG